MHIGGHLDEQIAACRQRIDLTRLDTKRRAVRANAAGSANLDRIGFEARGKLGRHRHRSDLEFQLTDLEHHLELTDRRLKAHLSADQPHAETLLRCFAAQIELGDTGHGDAVDVAGGEACREAHRGARCRPVEIEATERLALARLKAHAIVDDELGRALDDESATTGDQYRIEELHAAARLDHQIAIDHHLLVEDDVARAVDGELFKRGDARHASREPFAGSREIAQARAGNPDGVADAITRAARLHDHRHHLAAAYLDGSRGIGPRAAQQVDVGIRAIDVALATRDHVERSDAVTHPARDLHRATVAAEREEVFRAKPAIQAASDDEVLGRDRVAACGHAHCAVKLHRIVNQDAVPHRDSRALGKHGGVARAVELELLPAHLAAHIDAAAVALRHHHQIGLQGQRAAARAQ